MREGTDPFAVLGHRRRDERLARRGRVDLGGHLARAVHTAARARAKRRIGQRPRRRTRAKKKRDAHGLKLVIVAVKEPSALAVIACVAPSVDAMSTFPHGFAADGRSTSFRTGVPETPSAGMTIACADAWSARLAPTTTEARRDLEKSIVADFVRKK